MAAKYKTDLTDIRLNYSVYPGQPMVSAYLIMLLFDKLSDAAKITKHGWCEAESHNEIPGAGGVATEAVAALKSYCRHRNLHSLFGDLHYTWIKLVHPGNFDENLAEGITKAEQLHCDFLDLLVEKERNGFFDI